MLLMCVTPCWGESSYDRELVVKDQARALKVKEVLDEMIRAYENEDAGEFVEYVSEERFRQDYLTFTDALYQDFRTYEIHHIDYWVQRVVSDNVKQFLYVNWEKRYETLEDSTQLLQKGLSCFVFDEINGDYLLIQLQGNDLFGASLPEWTDETPAIPGQETVPVSSAPTTGGSAPSPGGTPSVPASLPDLTIIDIFEDGSQLTVFISNNGTGASTATNVLMKDIGMAGPETTSKDIPGIPPGGTYSVSFPFAATAPPYWFTVDANATVTESNESNNTVTYNE